MLLTLTNVSGFRAIYNEFDVFPPAEVASRLQELEDVLFATTFRDPATVRHITQPPVSLYRHVSGPGSCAPKSALNPNLSPNVVC